MTGHPADAAGRREPLILPFAVLCSIFLFLRATTCLAAASSLAGAGACVVLQAVAHAWSARASATITEPPSLGLLVAGLTGAASWASTPPLLTSSYDYPFWPVVGAVPLASAALFDLRLSGRRRRDPINASTRSRG